MRYCARGRQADASHHRQHGFGQGAGAEPLHDAGAMHFHRARTDTQLLADRLVRAAGEQPIEDLPFARLHTSDAPERGLALALARWSYVGCWP
jgi:hypothetical protein